jgi:large subunit ribosomal protein L4
MPVVDVKNLEGKKVGTLELADDVFSVKVNANLLHEAVRHHLAGLRSGTHKTKDKSEVSGAGRKLWKQKGTGRARIGSIRSPLWRHGGTVHGPVPRKYDYALPKKMITGALRSALSSKLAEEKLTIVDGWALDSHKTKPFREALTKLEKEARTILLVATGANLNLERASRNLEGVTLLPTNALGPYDLMRHDRLVLSRDAAEKLSRALSASYEGAPAAEESHSEAADAAPAKKAAPAKAEAKKKAAKKPAAAKSAKPKAKPKAKKD